MTLQKMFDNPAAVPPPAGHFSHVVRLGLGGDDALLFLSGQLALDADGRVVGPGDMRAQARHVMESLQAILAAHGATFADVVNIRSFVTDMSRLDAYAEVRRGYFPGPPPSSTTVEVSRLARDGAVLEVEVVAAVSGGQGA
ncbi:RidA family protein [Streptomyces sp. WMMC500]|uniref:RidA family protein n=1 Tax=Streptomyces sp. WMMC500 TaxID=3015154 RepID=UPI00248C6989|nr:RidA family protein [Streptomyces sp. WMMC500]WBB62647.1 RidA family protein [Streptomyces sp. WMMC500]